MSIANLINAHRSHDPCLLTIRVPPFLGILPSQVQLQQPGHDDTKSDHAEGEAVAAVVVRCVAIDECAEDGEELAEHVD